MPHQHFRKLRERCTTEGNTARIVDSNWGLRSHKCGEEEVVRGVHTLIAGVVQVYHGLHVGEEEEKVRKVVQEVEKEDQGEETAHVNMNMEMG